MDKEIAYDLVDEFNKLAPGDKNFSDPQPFVNALQQTNDNHCRNLQPAAVNSGAVDGSVSKPRLAMFEPHPREKRVTWPRGVGELRQATDPIPSGDSGPLISQTEQLCFLRKSGHGCGAWQSHELSIVRRRQ
jgi:hypothetical protein